MQLRVTFLLGMNNEILIIRNFVIPPISILCNYATRTHMRGNQLEDTAHPQHLPLMNAHFVLVFN